MIKSRWAICVAVGISFFVLLANVASSEDAVPWVLEEIKVLGESPDFQAQVVPTEDLESGRYTNVGEAVTDMPGISAVRRAAGATEPVIRGMGWERVATQVHHLPIYGVCPSRMDPPVTYARIHAAQKVTVVKGLPSVTLGPLGNGGRIIIDTDYRRPEGSPEGWEGWLRGGYDTARDGRYGEIGIQGGTDRLDLHGAVEGLRFDDYESADGIEVPAEQRGHSASLSMGIRPAEDQRWRNHLSYVREDHVDYPSLPMDLDWTDYWIYNTGYRFDLNGERLTSLDVEFGTLVIDHVMNNEHKPNRPMLHAETDSEARGLSGRGTLQWKLSDTADLDAGFDFFNLTRDALRTRFVIPSGTTFLDHIWPDTEQSDVGLFGELRRQFSNNRRIRLGLRGDLVQSDARTVDEPSLQNRTIRENFVRFYGPDAADVDETEFLVSGNLLFEWEPAKAWTAHLGAGLSSRPAGLTERYFAFASAPGGFQLGNPALDHEKKFEIEGEIGWKNSLFDFSMTVFHYWVNDYILSTEIDRLDVNADGVLDLVRGFVNVDARLYGGEALMTIRPLSSISLPLSLSYVRGRNTTDDRDLPEIPPLEGRAAVRLDLGEKYPWWCEFGGRFVSEQDRIDEKFPEDRTSGFSIFHLRGGLSLGERFSIQAGIENLFDRDYNEHLTREALMAGGDLNPGDEIPAPGRSAYVSFKLTL